MNQLPHPKAELLEDRDEVDHGPITRHKLLLDVDLCAAVVEANHAAQEFEHRLPRPCVDQHAVEELVQNGLWRERQEPTLMSLDSRNEGNLLPRNTACWTSFSQSPTTSLLDLLSSWYS